MFLKNSEVNPRLEKMKMGSGLHYCTIELLSMQLYKSNPSVSVSGNPGYIFNDVWSSFGAGILYFD